MKGTDKFDVTVEDYFSRFNLVIFADYQINCIKELIQYYREHADVSETADYNLQDIEKNLDTALSMNDYTLTKKNK